MTDKDPTRKSALREVLDAALDGRSLKSLTVLAPQRDPFRMDVPRRHADGAWFAEQVERIGRDRIHIRGIHYAIIGQPKPDGTLYENTDADWVWLVEDAVKSARWLDYVAFDKIIDQRNAEPVIVTIPPPEPYSAIEVGGFEIVLPDELEPKPRLYDFWGLQHHRLALFGEKVSLEPVLAPIAEQYDADLYLPTGESSDTMVYAMAKAAAEDGRPLVVFYFSDCDPAGWQMAVSVGRKLQAFAAVQFPGLEFEVRPVALTPDQVRVYGLPNTPLKASERRAAKWIEATGVEQTEIDALATLRPDLLAELAQAAIRPFWDSGLEDRVDAVREKWIDEAEQVLVREIGEVQLGEIREEAESRKAEIESEIEEMQVEVEGVELPEPPEIVHGEAPGANGSEPLISSEWDWTEQTEALIRHKAYENGGQD